MMCFLPQVTIFPKGSPRPRLALVLHGIFGSSRNWRGFARRFTAALPDWNLACVDLRCHGASKGAPPPHTLDSAARDLYELTRRWDRPPDAVIGHSFGAKVALAYTRARPEGQHQTWVLDCPLGAQAPGTGTRMDSEVGRLQALLATIEVPVSRRSAIEEQLLAQGFSEDIAAWMATNLRRSDEGGYDWNFELSGIASLLEDYWTSDFSGLLATAPPQSIHLVLAERGGRFTPDEARRLEELCERTGQSLHILQDAGHWLHVDNPAGLIEILKEGLRSPWARTSPAP